MSKYFKFLTGVCHEIFEPHFSSWALDNTGALNVFFTKFRLRQDIQIFNLKIPTPQGVQRTPRSRNFRLCVSVLKVEHSKFFGSDSALGNRLPGVLI